MLKYQVIAYTTIMIMAMTLPCASYNNTITHKHITSEAITRSTTINDYIVNSLGYATGVNIIINGETFADLIKKGSYEEDVPSCRASNHFHNPLMKWDESRMSDDPTSIPGLVTVDAVCNATGWFSFNRKSTITWATGYTDSNTKGFEGNV